jgi:dephospho-CoA kinase
MTTIAITGGIASGKSTVVTLFKKLGAQTFSADIIAKQLVEKDKPALALIANHFGKEILLENAQLNRKRLKEIIFSDSNKKNWLENLLHPLIRDELKRLCQISTAKINVVEIPLLAGSEGDYSYIDKIIVCKASMTSRTERIIKRDGITSSQAQTIIDAQPSDNALAEIATDFIDTDQSIEEIKADIQLLI